MATKYREEQLERMLREEIHERIEGVRGSVVITTNGLVVASYPSVRGQDPQADPASGHWVAALAAEIISQSRKAFGRLAQGRVRRVLVEGETGSMIVVPAGDHAALAVMIAPEVKLGLAMFQIGRVAERVGTFLVRAGR